MSLYEEPVMPTLKFPLGQCVITAAATVSLHPEDVPAAIARHGAGDWGELCEEDRAANEEALASHGRLFSAYKDRCGVRFYVITEHDRSVTTVLLPEDY
jgi:hypothetical protein